ncbi:MAG: FAD-binding oxidoreductase [Paracoccaceae bacterium]
MTLNPVTDAFLAQLRGNIPAAAFRDSTPHYLQEPRGKFSGQAGQVLAPASVQEVSTIIRAANHARIPVVPYGGGTGLVGGQVMPDGPLPLVLSLERMNKVRATYPDENVIIAEAGVILENLQSAATDADRLFPLSLASQGSCQIGGTLATNAGGVNVLRYGNARDLCLGLEAVLPNGDIWHGLKRLRKDNTGYDLRNLLIGSEGTLGVITAAALRLCPIPAQVGAALMVVRDPAAAIELLALASAHLGNTISGFELIHGTGLDFLAETMPQIAQPFEQRPEWSVLIDLGMAAGADPAEHLSQIFEIGQAAGLVSNGVVAQNLAQRQGFWTVREAIPAANKRIGPIASHDISVPISALPEFIKNAGQAIAEKGNYRINCFGHLGDGNLHYNIFPPLGGSRDDAPELGEEIRRLVHDLVAEFDGSFSAEHGLGRMKAGELKRYGDPAKLAAMASIKGAVDPNGIMNPGAVLA